LKKPERIEALSMVMVLTLLIYSVAEWMIRKRLKERNEFVPNQVNKPTQNPTLKWIFMDFMGVMEVKLNVPGEPERQLTNLNENARKIIAIL
jgi:transposase